MANYATLKAAIQQVVKTNGNNEITGALLQQSLLAMINSLGANYQFAGIATPSTNPGTPDQNVFYIASTAGTYANFGSFALADGEIAILKYNGAWSKDSTGAASLEKVNKLSVAYVLSPNSYINGNTIHIGTLYRLYSGLGESSARNYPVNRDYTLSTGAILCFNKTTETISVKAQANVASDDDILLWAGGSAYGVSRHFNFTGLLGTASLYDTISKNFAKNTDVSQPAYVLSPDSYISGNSIYIGTLYRFAPGGGTAKSYVVNNTLSGSTGSILVFNKTTETISVKAQANVLVDDEILLWCGGSAYGVSQHFNFTGLLGPASLYDLLSKSLGAPTPKTIVCSMVAEALWSANGQVYEPCDGTQKSTFCTPRFLKIDASSESIVSVDCESTENYYIFQYDKDLVFLRRNQNSLALNANTRYVKILVRLKSGDAYTYPRRKLEVVANLKADPEWVFNVANSGVDGNYMFRTYEIEMPIIPDTTAEPTENYQGVTTRVMNRGFICLPVDYSPFGKPSKVVIYCNGTSGYNFDSNSLPYNNSLVKFLAKCGYAVIGCSTRSELYKDTTQQAGADGDLVHPLSFSCYENLWKYMCEEFNIDRTGAHIFGLSSGGMMTILLSQMKTIPIKSAASLAGSVDMFSNMRICDGGLNEFWFNMLAMSYPNLPTGLSSNGRMQVVDTAVKTFVLNNLEKFIGVNPFWFNGDLPVASFIEQYFNTINYTAQLEANTNLVSIVNSAKINLSIPLKIWHAIDDANVPIAMSRFYRKMVLNGGGLCYLREFPANCGGHDAVGVDTYSGYYPKMDYETPFGETINVAVAWGELVDWFNRW